MSSRICIAEEAKQAAFYRLKGLYVQGAAHCEKLLKRQLPEEERKAVMLELAACYQFNTRDHTYKKAVGVYEEFLQEFPGDPLCAKAYFNIGRCYDAFSMERGRDIEKARAAYKSCYEKFSGSLWADQAYFWHANSFIYNLNARTATMAVARFEQFLKKYPDSFLRGVVHSQLSELYCAWLGKFEQAVAHSEAALAFGLSDINLRRLHLYRLAYVYHFKLGNKAKAEVWYRRLVEESPLKTDPNYFVARERIEELEAEKGGGK